MILHRLQARQFLRFLLVGAVNTAFGYGVFAGLIALGFHYRLAALISTVSGILFNFKTYGTFVFKDTRRRLFWRFLSVYAVVYVLTISAIAVLKRHGLDSFAAGAVLALPMALLSFGLNRQFVFSRMTGQRQGIKTMTPSLFQGAENDEAH